MEHRAPDARQDCSGVLSRAGADKLQRLCPQIDVSDRCARSARQLHVAKLAGTRELAAQRGWELVGIGRGDQRRKVDRAEGVQKENALAVEATSVGVRE